MYVQAAAYVAHLFTSMKYIAKNKIIIKIMDKKIIFVRGGVTHLKLTLTNGNTEDCVT